MYHVSSYNKQNYTVHLLQFHLVILQVHVHTEWLFWSLVLHIFVWMNEATPDVSTCTSVHLYGTKNRHCVLCHRIWWLVCSVIWCDVMCDVVWRGVTWCVMWCGVMCDVMWCVWCVVSCDVWCVMWFDMVWCGVIWCDVVWCDVVWCDVVWCDMWYGEVWYDVLYCNVKWYDVLWCERFRAFRSAP